MYLLDGASSSAGAEPLSNVFAQVLANEGHTMDAEWT